MPLTKDLSFDAHCVDPGAGANLMWTVPTRFNQTKLSASDSSSTQRTCGKRKSHSSDEERAWKGDRKRNGDDWSWAWSEEEKTSEWTWSMEENPPYSRWRAKESQARLGRSGFGARKNLSLKLKGLRSTRSLAGGKFQGCSQRQPLRPSGNCQSTSLIKLQRRHLQNKVIRGSLRHSHPGNPKHQHISLSPT